MRKSILKITGLFLAFVMVLSMMPVTVLAFGEDTFTASSEGTVIENRVFTGLVELHGSFAPYGESLPSIEFSDCEFKVGIKIIAGGDWDVILGDDNTVSGEITVINETSADMRLSDDICCIIDPPANSVINAQNVRVSVWLNKPDSAVYYNNVKVKNIPDDTSVSINRNYFYNGESVNDELSINGTAQITYTDECVFDAVSINTFNDNTSELNLDLTGEYFSDIFSLNSYNDVDFGCTCNGDEACTCECCTGNGVSGDDCGYICREYGYCDECRNHVPAGFIPGGVVVHGSVKNVSLELSGNIDISDLDFDGTETKIDIYDWVNYSLLNIGNKNVQVINNNNFAVSIEALEGAVISADSQSLDNIVVNSNFVIGKPHIFGGNNVFIGTCDADIEYTLSLNGAPVSFTKETLSSENKTHLNVAGDDEEIYYDFTAEKDGVTLKSRIYNKSIIVATPEGTYYSDIGYDSDVKVLSMCENNEYCRAQIDNCTFSNDINIEYDNSGIDIGFGCDVTIAGKINVTSAGDNRFSDGDVHLSGLPSGITVDASNVRVNINGDSPSASICINGADITVSDEADTDYYIGVNYNCYNQHDGDYNSYDHTGCDPAEQSQELNLSGGIKSFSLDNSSLISGVNINCVYNDVSGALNITDGGRLRFRVSSDIPEDVEDDRLKENPLLTLTGSVTDTTLELTGKSDISALGFSSTGDDEIMIGTWENSDVNIGAHNVRVTGGGENKPLITAVDGAVVNLDNERQSVNVNDGEIDMGLPHIFGREDNYNIFIGTADEEIEYTLMCSGEEVSIEPEYLTDDNKTHLNPVNAGNDINNWTVSAVKDGITVNFRVVHKEQLCPQHEFGAWSVETPGTCADYGYITRECALCGHIERVAALGEHSFTALTATESYLKSAATCSSAAVYYKSCEYCGASSEGILNAPTFSSGTALAHTPSVPVRENVVEPTCTFAGSYNSAIYCSVCNTLISKTPQPLAKTEHYFISQNSSPKYLASETTCTQPAKYYYSCAFCGKTCANSQSPVTFDVGAANGHNYGSWSVSQPATAQNPGEERRICYVCNAIDTRPIAKLTNIEVTEKAGLKLSSGRDAFAVPGLTAGELLSACTHGDVIIDSLGNAVQNDAKLCSGMRIVLLSGTDIADSVTVIIPGDIDGDGNISASDARLALRAAVGLDNLNSWQSLSARVNNAANVTSSEARLILRAAVGLENASDWVAGVH